MDKQLQALQHNIEAAVCDRSHAPAWERTVWPLQRLLRTAGAVLATFPRWSVGTITFRADIKHLLEQARGSARSAVNAAQIGRFSTQCVENLDEVAA
jgi:hypothetical protein